MLSVELMPATTTAPPLTVDDYRLLPETGPRYQLIEGDLVMAPAPNRFHQDISLNLVLILAPYVRQEGIGKLYEAPFDVYLDNENVFQPDIVFVSKERSAILTKAGAEGAPDLAIEILSQRTRKIDTDVKLKVFARSGVRELWIVDPESRGVSVYELQSDTKAPVAAFGQDDRFERPMFPGLKFEVEKIFAR